MKTYKEIRRNFPTEDGLDILFGVEKTTLKEGDIVIGFDPLYHLVPDGPYEFQVFKVERSKFPKLPGELVLHNQYGQVYVNMYCFQLYKGKKEDWEIFGPQKGE
jgi:hypothetical protein